MLTRKALNHLLDSVFNELIHLDLKPEKMILFGSYAKENIHIHSDIDLAIWNNHFSGNGMEDLELIRPILRKFGGLDIKMYPSGANAVNFDPFIEEIEKTGFKWIPELKRLENKPVGLNYYIN